MFSKITRRLRALFKRSELDRELDEELHFHLEREAGENIRRGMSPDEAMRTALLRFGGVERVKEECREERGLRVIQDVRQDVHYGLRTLRKQPGFALVAIITLALGVGANTAIFSVVNAILLRPLSVEDPQRLVFLSNPERHGVNGEETGERRLLAYYEFEWLRDHNRVFTSVLATQSTLPDVPVMIEGESEKGEPEMARISPVSGSYFSTLGVSATRGRTFGAEVDKAVTASPVVVISYDYWRRRFALDPTIIMD